MIRTTHVGSLQRGDVLTPLLLARDKGEPYDTDAFDATVQEAVDDAVARQVAAGVSVASDGELGKIGYSTYMIERLEGFGGHIDRKPAADLAEHPGLSKKLAAIMGSHDCATLIARYANLNDAGAWNEVAALFAPDGRMARPTAPDDWVEGRAAILASSARKTRHLCTNIVVTATTPESAHAESAMALFLPDGAIKVGTFLDRFALVEGTWLFSERRGMLSF